MMDISRVQHIDWKCPICSDIMDGDNQRDVAISKRCFHVFHDACIRQWVDEHKGNCPICKLSNFSNIEIISNPDFVKQYNLWKANPDNFSYDKDLLRPESLRGLTWRNTLTKTEAWEYYDEIGRQIEELNPETSWEKINKLKEEKSEAEQFLLREIENGQDKIQQTNIDQFKRIKEINDHLDVGDLHAHFIRKLKVFAKKAEDKIKGLEGNMRENYELIRKLGEFKVLLFIYRDRFDLVAETNLTNPNNPTPEEATRLLKEVDVEMGAFIDSQPNAVREILRAVSLNPIIYQNQVPQPNQWPSRKTLFKIVFVATGVLLIYCLWRAGDSKNLTKNIKIQKPDL